MLPTLAALLVSTATAPAPRLWLPNAPITADDAPNDSVLALCGEHLRRANAQLEEGRLRIADCDATFAVAGLPQLTQRRIVTAKQRTGPLIRTSPSGPSFVQLQLGRGAWRIDRVRLASTGYRLVLSDVANAKPPVTLYEAQSTDAARWQVLWAGDLDGDRQLDLLVEASDASDFREVHLFLSKDAEELVDEVATERIRGEPTAKPLPSGRRAPRP